MTDNASHTAEFWAGKRRSLDTYTVKRCRDTGTGYEFLTTDSTGFIRAKADVGAPLAPGDVFDLECAAYGMRSKRPKPSDT